MLLRLDKSELRFRAAHIAKCPNKSAIIYPDGILGRGILLTSSQLTVYLAERDRHLQRFIRFQGQYGLLTWVSLFVVIIGLLLTSNQWVLLIVVLAGIPLLVIALIWTRHRTAKLFATLFPQAPYAADTVRYQRWKLAMMISPEFGVGRCCAIVVASLILLVFAIFGLFVGSALQELWIAFLCCAIAIWLLGLHGYLLFHHAKFRLGHHRRPCEMDLKTLRPERTY